MAQGTELRVSEDGSPEKGSRLGKLRRVLWILGVLAVVNVIGQIISRKMTEKLTVGDEDSDEFQIAAIMGGKEFHSRARRLKRGAAITSMGGADVDLREATLDPAGAELELKTTMGGVQVIVPAGWAVDVDKRTVVGGFEVKVTPPEDLPEGAPTLRVHAVTRMGGGLVTAKG